MTSSEPLGIFAVKMISTDDFHFHLLWFLELGLLTRDQRNEKLEQRRLQREQSNLDLDIPPVLESSGGLGGGIRDILSAAPAPWNSERHKVDMSLSSYGTACVVVNGDFYEQRISVLSEVKFDSVLITYFLVGVFIIGLSKEIGKSKFFQYFCGSTLFVAMGLLFAALSITSRLDRGRKRNQLFVTFMTVSGYGISLLYILFNKLRTIIFDYAEFFLLYVGVMALIGVFFTSKLRTNENKDTFRLACKYLLRY